MKKKRIRIITLYLFLSVSGFVMLYPLIWMFSATFKTNSEIFGSISLFPENPVTDGYKNLFSDYGGNINIIRAMVNTLIIIVPKVIFTVVSSAMTAYGFSRFNFRGKKIMFALLVFTLFIPDSVMMIPQFIMFSKFGWIDSPFYTALTVPSLFAFEGYFIFMLVQFMRGIPAELDEAAKIDGCESWQILIHIISPVIKPAIVSCAVFQFIWTSNDFMGPLLYVNTPSAYPLSIFVKLSMDADSGFQWNRVLAVSLVSIIPSVVVFFCSQKTFTDGITSGALKE